MTADEVKHNFKLNKGRYNLFDWDCPDCEVIVPECDLSAIVYEITTTTTTIPVTTTTTTIPVTTTTTTIIPCDVNYELYNIPLDAEVILIANLYPGSIEAVYSLQLSNTLDFDLSVTFTHILGTISGDSINIESGVVIPKGLLSGETIVIRQEDYNILNDTSEFVDVKWSPYWADLVISLSSETIFNLNPCNQYLLTENDDFIIAENGSYIITELDLCLPTPTPTLTSSPTPTPTLTSSPTPTPTLTSSQTPTPTLTSSQTPTPSPTPTLTLTPNCQRNIVVPTLWNGATSINSNTLQLTQTSETLQIQVNDTITDNNGSTSFVGIVSSDGTYTYVFTGAGGGVSFDCEFPLTFTGPC